jgi:hypothetical protein
MLSAALDAGGFGLGPSPSPAGVDPTAAARTAETAALAEVTSASLEAADSLASLNLFLTQASHDAAVLREESARMGAQLRVLRDLGDERADSSYTGS